jgi:copper chaperone NosL
VKKILAVLLFFLVFGLHLLSAAVLTNVVDVVENARCPVCGMFVAKYQNWLTQLRFSDGGGEAFDGVKDMMAYYFSPESFGGKTGASITEVQVRDYYSGNWIDGKKAFYVLGSDVMGPMGHELIPFEIADAADNFRKDHKGKKLLGFDEIKSSLIGKLRSGHKMKMKK